MSAGVRWTRLRLVPSALFALGLAAAVEVAVRTTRLPTMARTFGAPLAEAEEVARAAPGRPVLSVRESRRLRAVSWALRRSPLGDTCLRQALCAGFVLRAREPRLAIGVAKRDGAVAAHAWLVVDGLHLDPSGTPDFRPLDFARTTRTP